MVQTVKHPNRVDDEPAFLLCATPWRETSLLAEVYSRQHGRIGLIARSARKMQSELRGVLVCFVPLSLSWYGREELKTLHRANWIGGWPQPQGQALFSALYANELLYRLTTREQPNAALYDALQHTMRTICNGQSAAAALRLLEWCVLRENGAAPDVRCDADGQKIQADARYAVAVQMPFRRLAADESTPLSVSGAALLALDAGVLSESAHLSEILHLNRLLLSPLLPEDLTSRKIMQQINAFVG